MTQVRISHERMTQVKIIHVRIIQARMSHSMIICPRIDSGKNDASNNDRSIHKETELKCLPINGALFSPFYDD